jgi:opacity protein-like surface antigen
MRTNEPFRKEVGMKKVILAMIVVLFCTAGVAHAMEGFYIAPKLGYSLLNFDDPELSGAGQSISLSDKEDDVWGGGLALGYDMARRGGLPVRVEIEGFLRDRGTKSWDRSFTEENGNGVATLTTRNRATVSTLFANAYFDIPLGWMLTPYVGGGLGISFIDYRTNLSLGGVQEASSSDDRTNFAWNLGAGLAWGFTQNMALDLNYRYVDAGRGRTDVDLGLGEEVRSRSDIFLHEFLLGLRYTF